MSLAADVSLSPHAPVATRAPTLDALGAEFVPGADWDAAMAGFDEACQEQLSVFAAHRWPSARQEAVLFRRHGRVVGGTLMLIQKLPLGLASMAVTKWGPLLAESTASDAEALYAGMIDWLVAEYAERRGMMLSVLPAASTTPHNARREHLATRGFRAGSELLFPSRYLVRLGIPAEEQRRSLAQKWRYHLNRSEKQNLVFEHAPRERIGEFHALYTAMTDRKQFSDHSAYETLEPLMRMQPASLRPELFFVRQGEELVGGAVVFTAGKRAVYLYGATNERALPLRAGYFLHWHIIDWLGRNTGAEWYDLGGTDGYQGLHQFKKGMVGSAGIIEPVPPVANYAARPLAFIMGNGAFRLRDSYHAARRAFDAWRNPKARPDQRREGESRAETGSP